MNEDYLAEQFELIEEYVRRARSIAARGETTFLQDPILIDAATRELTVLFETAHNIAKHILSSRDWQKADSKAAAFEILERHGVIEAGMSQAMRQAARFPEFGDLPDDHDQRTYGLRDPLRATLATSRSLPDKSRTGSGPPRLIRRAAILFNTMPKRTDIHRIMIIGSGPIVIGQACEFVTPARRLARPCAAKAMRSSWSTPTRRPS
ncbi:MAG: HepT-like ribonuclease domain-containing protein [Bryobacterales bacterium]